MSARVDVLGIRHHGPGSARTVAAALTELAPDLVLVEGAPELSAVVGLVASPEMVPPVAGLVHDLAQPAHALFYPMASFSPEWVALRYALARDVPARFVDLPAATMLAAGWRRGRSKLRDDPLAVLAELAGYDDPERWWEEVIEQRYHGGEVFDAVLDLMTAVREAEGDPTTEYAAREAAMRKGLRAAIGEGRERIAFVCGAWHAPALVPARFPPAARDDEVLRKLPKVKVAATWVPWTSDRLARESGYGAGVDSPGWYEHLFTTDAADVVPAWMTRAARLLRGEHLDVSSGAVIDAVRLAGALAVVRGRPLAGLDEVMEASEVVLCAGSRVALDLVRRRLVVGEMLGTVPAATPMVPIARDLVARQKTLRLKPAATPQTVDLDLRTPGGLARSLLLHRLRLIDVRWGEPADTGATGGTFKERWIVQWHPELDVALIEASGWGTTIEAATIARAAHLAATTTDLRALTLLAEQALLADLPTALVTVIDALAARTAAQHDTTRLMAALEPLARVQRYGDVRAVDTAAVAKLVRTMVTRIAVGLPAACASLDDNAAAHVRALLDSVHRAVGLLDDAELRAPWDAALARVADQTSAPGAVAGRAVRLLLDRGRLAIDDARRRLSVALSRAADAHAGAMWLESFLAGDALLLVHDHALLAVIDDWLLDVGGAVFDDVLPVLRRAFATFTPSERRTVGEHVRRRETGDGVATIAADDAVDPARAERVLPRLREILGDEVDRV